jgi:pimeloyl-ACP methyl ester carboxylesterase
MSHITISKRTKILMPCMAILILGLGFALNRAAVGIPFFYLWKAISGKSHGGHYADINGVRIYYETYGAGRPVLVLHGGTAFLETMHYQIRALSATRFVIAPDSRGHGRSTDSNAPLGYALMADDMLQLLDLAMHHPERVGRVAVSGTNYDVAGLVTQASGDDRPCDQDLSAGYFYKLVAPDPAHWAVFYQKVITMWQTQPHYTLADLGKIQAPVLVMAGQFDCIKRTHTDQLARAIPNAHEQIIRGATHMAPLEQPDLVDAAMLSFLHLGDVLPEHPPARTSRPQP